MPKLIELLFEQGQIYLLLFIFFYSFICFDFLFKHSFRLMFFSISLFILSLISGLRFEVGTDWEPYKNLFNDLELDWSFLVNVFNFDFGYVLFNAFIRIFTDSYAVFLFLDSLIALGFIGWFIYKYSPLPNLSLFFFYNTYFISTYMGSNRRIIAIGLSLISLSALIETKRAKTYLYALIALLFHRTSFIVFFAKFLPTHVPKLKIVVLGLFISFIIGLFQLPFKLFGVISQAVSHLNNIPVFSKLIYYSDIDNNKAVVSENLNTAILFTFSSIKRLFLISIFYSVLVIGLVAKGAVR